MIDCDIRRLRGADPDRGGRGPTAWVLFCWAAAALAGGCSFDAGVTALPQAASEAHVQAEAQAQGARVATVVVAELVVAQPGQSFDDDAQAHPWAVLHNPGVYPVDLSGYALSADARQPLAWTFPPGVHLAPGERLRVWLSGKDRRTLGGALHTNFGAQTPPGLLLLSAPDGAGGAIVLDRVRWSVRGSDLALSR